MGDRPQREGRGRKADKSGAIAKLREAQAGGKRRTEQYSAPSEAPIYEEVNDDHYEKIKEGDNFVVDEVHYGEDEELEVEEADKQRALEAQRKKDAKKRGAFNVTSKAKVTHEAPAQSTKIPDVILGVAKRTPTAPKPAAVTSLSRVMVKTTDIDEDAGDNEDLFAELDPAAEFARVHERAPIAKKARVEDPSFEEDLPPPEAPEDPELLRQLDELDPVQPTPPTQHVNGANANVSSQKPGPILNGASQAPMHVAKIDMDMADVALQPQQRAASKRPLPPPPSVDMLPPVNAEPLLVATSTGDDVPRKEPDGSYHFFMLDASDDPLNVPGVVYLFGKIFSETKKKYVSATVIVTGMERCLFVAPREFRRDAPSVAVKFPDDVFDELETIREREKIAEFQMKDVKRNYVWERADIPMGVTNFVKVKYPSNNSPLPQSTSGDTFSHIYGTNTAPLESFIIKRRVRGPSWLSVMNAEITPAGSMRCNTKLELRVGGPRAISPLESAHQKELPTLSVLSMNLKTIANEKHQQEVVMCTMLCQQSVNMDGPTTAPLMSTFCAVRKLASAPLPLDLQEQLKKQNEVRIEVCQSERQILSAMLNQIQAWDPDVLVAHNFYGFDLDVLLHRMQEHKTPGWYRLGQLKKSKMPKLVQLHGHDPSFAQRSTVSGRLVCDTYLAAKDLLRSQKNYSLTELAKTQLGQPRAEFDYDQVPEFFETGAKVISLSKFSIQDAYLALQLMHKLLILPLTKQLSNLAGNLWSRSLTGARAERIEYLLLHEFRTKKLILPDKRKDEDEGATNNKNAPGSKKDNKPDKENDAVDDDVPEDAAEPLLPGAAGAGAKKKWKKKNKPAYEGGKVLEPKKGFYDKYILLLDFQSLYPSIIQEFNICFTTVPRTEDGSGEPPGASKDQGLLPEVIRSLVERRRSVKGHMKVEKDPQVHKQYDIKQQALKLVANSMYGCLGYVHSRFFAVRLAKLVTKKGRETLEKTKELVDTKGNVEIIYGDTDSIMVNTRSDNYEEVLKIGQELKKEINKLYKRLEIEIDGIFKSLLLLKKKKYAALVVLANNTGVEKQVKGLEVVRRDWCDLSREMGSAVLDIILSGKSKDDVNMAILEYLSKQTELIMANKIGLSKFIITKSISKNPEDYPDAKSQPHVQVALKMKAAGKTVRVGDHIQYIICRADEGKSASDRAEMPETVKNGAGAFVIDTNWYMEQQILPPLLRHCDPLDSLEPAAIGKALGLAEGKVKSRMQQLSASAPTENYIPTSYMTDEQRFGLIFPPLRVECPSCRDIDEWRSTTRDEAQKLELRKFSCLKCNKMWASSYVANVATLFLRDAFEKYYRGMYLCEDGNCNNRSQQVYDKGYPLCAMCQRSKMRREYTETYVLERMQYLVALFSHKHQELQVRAAGREKLLESPQVREMYEKVALVVDEYLARHAGNYVDLSQLFSFKAALPKPI